ERDRPFDRVRGRLGRAPRPAARRRAPNRPSSERGRRRLDRLGLLSGRGDGRHPVQCRNARRHRERHLPRSPPARRRRLPEAAPAAMTRAPGIARPLRTTLEMIRVSHTIFALPFAILSAVLAAGGWPAWSTVAKILVAMVGARSAAMAQNRLADREIDGMNPRTASRALPAGMLSVGYVRAFLVVSVGV